MLFLSFFVLLYLSVNYETTASSQHEPVDSLGVGRGE